MKLSHIHKLRKWICIIVFLCIHNALFSMIIPINCGHDNIERSPGVWVTVDNSISKDLVKNFPVLIQNSKLLLGMRYKMLSSEILNLVMRSVFQDMNKHNVSGEQFMRDNARVYYNNCQEVLNYIIDGNHAACLIAYAKRHYGASQALRYKVYR